MRLQDFDLLADENIDPAVVTWLRRNGFDVLDVKEAGLIGSSDSHLIPLSVEQNRVILTHDSDFGRSAIAMLEPIVGIVFLRPGHLRSEFTVTSIQTILDRDLDLIVPFIIVADHRHGEVNIRMRRY